MADVTMPAADLATLAGSVIAGVLLAGVALYWLGGAVGALRATRRSALVAKRVRTAEAAAATAALDEPAFAPARIRAAVGEILAGAQRAWQRGAVSGLRGRSDGPAIERWARSEEGRLGTGLHVLAAPRIDILQVVNRRSEREDRVMVLLHVRLRREHPAPRGHESGAHPAEPHTLTVQERWTLARRGRDWILLAVESAATTDRALGSSLVPSPDEDAERLHARAVREVASLDAGLDAGLGAPDVSELTRAGDSPAQALRDLSVIDGRFADEALDEAVKEVLLAWEEATIGVDDRLRAVADPRAMSEMLYPSSRRGTARIVVRDAELRGWRPVSLRTAPGPVEVTLAVDLSAVRFLVSGHPSGVLAGNATDPRRMRVEWTFRLRTGSQGWRLIATSDPADEIPA